MLDSSLPRGRGTLKKGGEFSQRGGELSQSGGELARRGGELMAENSEKRGTPNLAGGDLFKTENRHTPVFYIIKKKKSLSFAFCIVARQPTFLND